MKRRSTEEIAKDIIAAIKDAGGAIEMTVAKMCGWIENTINDDRLNPKSRKHNAEYFGDIIKWIDKGGQTPGRPS